MASKIVACTWSGWIIRIKHNHLIVSNIIYGSFSIYDKITLNVSFILKTKHIYRKLIIKDIIKRCKRGDASCHKFKSGILDTWLWS